MKKLLIISLLSISYTLFAPLDLLAEDAPYDSVCYKQMQVSPTVEPPLYIPKCRISKDTLFIDGLIDNAMFYELKYHPAIKHIELNSYGGDLYAALEIAELIRGREISTNVRKDGKCASACTLLFQAGARRTIYPTVKFLYHGPRLGLEWLTFFQKIRDSQGREKSVEFVEKQFELDRLSTNKLFNAYIKYGMSEEFLEKYKSLPESNNWFHIGNFGRTKDHIIGAGDLFKYNITLGFDYRESIDLE